MTQSDGVHNIFIIDSLSGVSMDNILPKIGEEIGSTPPPVFQLILDDHVKCVNPADYNITARLIKPVDYFVTSGDAVEKARILERDLWELAGELRKKCCAIIAEEHSCTQSKANELYQSGIRPQNPAGLKEFESEIWKSAGFSRKLVNALLKAKGDNIFLETEWENHRLLCIPKNPRRISS